MEPKHLLLFSMHLVYIPIALIYVFGFGEDLNTDLLGLVLVTIITVVSFIYNTAIILISYALIENPKYKILPFLAPTIIAVLLKAVLNIWYSSLDFGNENTLWLIIGISLLFNLSIYYLSIVKPKHATAS